MNQSPSFKSKHPVMLYVFGAGMTVRASQEEKKTSISFGIKTEACNINSAFYSRKH